MCGRFDLISATICHTVFASVLLFVKIDYCTYMLEMRSGDRDKAKSSLGLSQRNASELILFHGLKRMISKLKTNGSKT